MGTVAVAAQQVDLEQVGHEPRGGSGRHLLHRARLDHPTALDDDEAIGEHRGVHGVVGDEQARTARGDEVVAQLGADRDARRRVERREGFVEQQQPGGGGQGAGEGHALGLPAG